LPTKIENAFMGIKACILNLDGVIVDTVQYHYVAWRRFANELGFDFSAEQHETLRGLSRMESMEAVLTWGNVYLSEAEKLHWADVKNNWYLAQLLQMQPQEVLPGVLIFLQHLQAKGIKMAVASGSRNAKSVIHALALNPFFEVITDGSTYRKPKPNPECYIQTARALDLPPRACIVFEDMPSGLMAARFGGFPVVGVGRKADLSSANLVINGFEGLTLAGLLEQLEFSLIQSV
jgi:beta-phosphoglucomutase